MYDANKRKLVLRRRPFLRLEWEYDDPFRMLHSRDDGKWQQRWSRLYNLLTGSHISADEASKLILADYAVRHPDRQGSTAWLWSGSVSGSYKVNGVVYIPSSFVTYIIGLSRMTDKRNAEGNIRPWKKSEVDAMWEGRVS